MTLALFLGGAGILFFALGHSTDVSAQLSSAESVTLFPTTSSSAAKGDHPVYAHSIVKGGIHSVAELLEVLRTNPEVAAHYRNFNVSKARIVRLNHPLLGYVSYRMEGKGIFWTIHKISIPANEPLLFDGNLYIRLRCGNVISTRAMTRINRTDEPNDLDAVIAMIPPLHESGPDGESSEFFPESSQQSQSTPNLPAGSGGGSPTISAPPQTSFLPPGGGGGCVICFITVPPVVPPTNPAPPTAVPEPGSLALLAIGIGALWLLTISKYRRPRTRSRQS